MTSEILAMAEGDSKLEEINTNEGEDTEMEEKDEDGDEAGEKGEEGEKEEGEKAVKRSRKRVEKTGGEAATPIERPMRARKVVKRYSEPALMRSAGKGLSIEKVNF